MKPHRLWLIPVVVALSLAIACSSDDASKPSPTQGASSTQTTASATATPAALPASTPVPWSSLGLETTPIRWVDAPEIVAALNSATEPDDPFALERVNLPGDPPQWSVYVAPQGQDARQVYNTRRWLRDLTWDTSGLSADFMTKRDLQPPGLDSPGPVLWRGSVTIDPATAQTHDDFEDLPWAYEPDPRSFGPNPVDFMAIQRPDVGNSILVMVGTRGGPLQDELQAVYIIDSRGRGKKLEGLSGLRHVNWFPNGEALQAFKSSSGGPDPRMPSNETYVIPRQDGDAIFLGNSPFGVENVTYSDKAPVVGSRAVFLLPKPGGAERESIMVIYDSLTHQARLLGPGPALPAPSPNVFFHQVPIIWPGGSDKFVVGVDIDSVVVDALTGAMQPGKPQDILPAYQPPQTISPNGRYIAAFDEPQYAPVDEECRGKPFRLKLTDQQTNQTKTLAECASGTSGYVIWLDDTKLIAGVASCWGCEANSFSLTLIDVTTGETKPLTNGLEPGAAVVPSPDKQRLLVSGASLRVFDGDGALLRDLGPAPADSKITSMVWSPDGSSFAYVVEQGNRYLGGP